MRMPGDNTCGRCQGAGYEPPATPADHDPLRVQHGGGHYKGLAIQPVEYCQRNRINFAESSAIKYLTRHKDKNGAEDLKKALHFVQLALSLEYGIQSNVSFIEQGSHATA